MSTDNNLFIDFTSHYWLRYLETLAAGFKKHDFVDNGICIVKNRNKRILITHPFWSKFDIDMNIINVGNIIKA